MKKTLLLFLFFFLVDLSSSLNDEGVALLRFREKVEADPYDALLDWDERNGANPCWWSGVECSHGRVVALNLQDLCLKGTLAPELGQLTHLKFLILQNNSFWGNIPREIGDLHKLEVLDLQQNNFTGSLPSELGKIASLKLLILRGNIFIGTIPPELYDLIMNSELQIDEGLLSLQKRHLTRNVGNITLRRLLQVGGEDRVWQQLRKKNNTQHHAPSNGIVPSMSPSLSPFHPPELSPSPSASSPSTIFPPSPNIHSPTLGPSPSPSIDPSSVLPSPFDPSIETDSQGKRTKFLTISMSVLGVSSLLAFCIVYFLCCRNKSGVTVRPWVTGLSGQLQKAFVTGVPALKRSEMETACEGFSNIIGFLSDCNMYKGTLSSGVEIAVISTVVSSAKDWSKQSESEFRKKISTLSKVNHKNFVNLIGYCEEREPFTRMMVFEYAPNGTLFEHLHVKEMEHLDWGARLRIAMGVAYCLDYLHQLNPPVILNHLDSSTIYLTDDYAAKVGGDIAFWSRERDAQSQSEHSGPLDVLFPVREHIVCKFGMLMLEIISGTCPSSDESLVPEDKWVSSYLDGTRPIKDMIDPSLTSYREEDIEALFKVIRSCVNSDLENRPTMGEVSVTLKNITSVLPDGATPRVSPLWWAELEIISSEAS